MRRRVVIAIVGVFVVVVAGLAVWATFSGRLFVDSAGRLRPGTQTYKGQTLAKVPVPQSGLEPKVAKSVAPSGQGVTADLAASYWADVSQAAELNDWQAWGYMIDAATGEVLLSQDAKTSHTPASIMKVVTSLVALNNLDPTATLSTGTSLSGSDLYLFGEGDLLLSDGTGTGKVDGKAGLEDLAASTATELQQRGISSVTLHYQDKLFDGEKRLAIWAEQEVNDYVGDVGPFAIDTGRTGPGFWEFVDDSSHDVATAFEQRLKDKGIAVASVTAGEAKGGAEQIASVHSATIGEQIAFFMRKSDNTLAEQYCHLAAAKAGVSTDFASVTKFAISQLSELGVDTAGMVMDDCSGLSSRSRVSGETMVKALQASAAGTDGSGQETPAPAGSLIRVLPRAGLNGTMAERFGTSAAKGNVQAKTGSLTTASTLAGVLTTDNGQTLLFAIGYDNGEKTTAYYGRPHLEGFIESLISPPS